MDGIARDLEGRARVLRINVLDQVGAQAAQRYGVRGVPAFIVFDGQGQPVHTQVGFPDRADLVARAIELARQK